ncbi:glutaconate CoA-transferase subunit A [Enhydrobacter aerosaccus]|uniref:Glutaconate CoA-transferase subunit A n=1 Tax=Enhydrobacter aerosaccus TaxID=225324 RepID=A0A1T4RXM4_9HYPH|nr:CoA-transferase [Enhydrobacter aerosaccus]SKA20667.1 glutaconate CoA-transferase subunit A [Enhydrobacter aerosaccus]
MSQDWLRSSVEELATQVSDGAKIAVPHDGLGVAMETTRALIRRGVRDLHLVCVPVSDLQADLLIGAGCVRTLETSAISFGEHGTPHRFHAALKAGTIEMRDATCPAIHAAIEAGRKNIPFIPLRGIIGSDLLTHRSDWKVIDNPFAAHRDPIVLLPAIRPDFAVIHAPYADRDGNIFIGRQHDLAVMAQAAIHGALVTVEEVRDVDLLASEETAAGTLPAIYVAGSAVAARGAWPLGLADHYETDEAHLRDYSQLARTADGFARYLDEFVHRRRQAAE